MVLGSRGRVYFGFTHLSSPQSNLYLNSESESYFESAVPAWAGVPGNGEDGMTRPVSNLLSLKRC